MLRRRMGRMLAVWVLLGIVIPVEVHLLKKIYEDN